MHMVNAKRIHICKRREGCASCSLVISSRVPVCADNYAAIMCLSPRWQSKRVIHSYHRVWTASCRLSIIFCKPARGQDVIKVSNTCNLLWKITCTVLPWLEWPQLLTFSLIVNHKPNWKTRIFYLCISATHPFCSSDQLFLPRKMLILVLLHLSVLLKPNPDHDSSFYNAPTSPLWKMRWKKEWKKNPLTLPSSPFFFES